MAIGIYLFRETKKKPEIVVDYYSTDKRVSLSILEELIGKHKKKGLIDALVKKGKYNFYSSEISEKNNLYLGFILEQDEDLKSQKEIFEEIEDKIIDNYKSIGKKEMENFLEETLHSIMDLIEKLKNPELIRDEINKRTKQLLDENKIDEAKKLIDLGETVPGELSELIKDAEDYLKDEKYKKAKKSYLKAAERAKLIQEDRIASFLESRGEKVGTFPDLKDQREDLMDDIMDALDNFEREQLHIYKSLIQKVNVLMKIAEVFNQEEKYAALSKILYEMKKASTLGADLYNLHKKITTQFEEDLK
ncbi:MAG: hypothetical protein EU541_06435 [Promethearchaeota archaeon]|nr:MAG: hypothetical protein EU541_06435 [Candidatus Lokiarchaeota archaeon]